MELFITDQNGNKVTPERASKIKAAHWAMMELTDYERGLIMCWYCRWCWRYISPGEICHYHAKGVS